MFDYDGQAQPGRRYPGARGHGSTLGGGALFVAVCIAWAVSLICAGGVGAALTAVHDGQACEARR